MGGADRLYPRVTIDALPDYVLLETFEIYLGKDDPDYFDYHRPFDTWQTLVHVCHRWRCVVFFSPRRLNLKLFCTVTERRSFNSKTLDIWPILPIVIYSRSIRSKEDETNLIALLGQHNRLCKLDYFHSAGQFEDSFLKNLWTIDESFPAMTTLNLGSDLQQDVPVLPDSFLGRSAPRLRSLALGGIPYPSVGKLLSSTTNLVRLSLWDIPHSGYIAPETIAPLLPTLSRLESFELGLKHPRSWALRASRHPPPPTRVVFPNLLFLRYRGDIEYLEDILSQIETPILNQISFCFFNQLEFDTPLLGQFCRRTKFFKTFHTAYVTFSGGEVLVSLLGQKEVEDGRPDVVEPEVEDGLPDAGEAEVSISCKPLDWQLSTTAQVLESLLSFLPPLENLDIVVYEYWQEEEVSREYFEGEIEVAQWREFLHLFTFVKKMTLGFEDAIRLVAPALQEFAEERATEVLPALQMLSLSLSTYDWQPSGPVKEAIERFVATRQLCGHSVTVNYY